MNSVLAFVSVFALPGVTIQLVAVTGVLVVLLIVDGITHVVGGLLKAMAGWIPFIGGYIESGINAVISAMDTYLRTWLEGAEELLGIFWDGIGQSIEWITDAAEGLGGAIYDALHTVKNVTIPQEVETATLPLADKLDQHALELGLIEVEAPTALERLAADLAILRDFAAGRIDGLTVGLAILADFVELQIGTIELDLDEIRTTVTETLPQRIEEEIGAVETKVGSIEDALTGALPYITTVAAGISAGALVQAGNVATEAEPKLKRLCQLELDEVDDLLELALILPSWALIVSMLSLTAGELDRLMGVMTPSLPN